MKPLQNQLHLPEPFVVAAQRDEHDRGAGVFRSVTELIGPARAAAILLADPDAEEVEDVADRIHMLLGKALHAILERAGVTGIRERRWYATIGGRRLSGQTDYLDIDDTGLLTDWKSTSIYTVLHAQRHAGVRRTRYDDWEAQLNCYGYLAFLEGYEVTGLEAVVVLDGWLRAEARRVPTYPQAKVLRVPFPQWEHERTQAYLAGRIQAHAAAEGALPHCTADEQWRDPAVWAGYKGAAQRATKLFVDEAAARASGLRLEFRPALAKRCLPGRDGYCPVRSACIARDDGQFAPGMLGVPQEDDAG